MRPDRISRRKVGHGSATRDKARNNEAEISARWGTRERFHRGAIAPHGLTRRDCDVARPVKHSPEMAAYRVAEARLMAVIAARFGFDQDEPASVKAADRQILGIEARDLMAPLLPGWERWLALIGDCPLRITRPWGPEEAEERFLDRFRELTAAPAYRAGDIVKWAASILGSVGGKMRRKGVRREEIPVLFDDAA